MNKTLVPLEYHLTLKAKRIGCQMTETLQNLQLILPGKAIFRDIVSTGRWLLFQIDLCSLNKPVDSILSTPVLHHLEARIRLPCHKLALPYPLPGLQPGRYIAVELYREDLPNEVLLNISEIPDKLTIAVGHNKKDSMCYKPLPALGHSLIIGTTGMGKSSFMHTCLVSVLTKTPVQDVQIVLCDVKGAEFSLWEHALHLLAPVAKTPLDCAMILSEIVGEIGKRNLLFAQEGCQDIYSYHAIGKIMPFIWVLVDEVIDLILRASKEDHVADSLKIIASTGRSAGIILWLATQHATKDAGLPRVVTVNLTSRFCFRVGDSMAARAIGIKGAHLIPRIPGRMIADISDESFLAQAPYLRKEDLKSVIEQLSKSTTSPLTELEWQLVDYAINNLGSQFTIGKLFQAFRGKVTHHKISEIAKRFEKRGWLTAPAHATDSRKISESLFELIKCHDGCQHIT